MTDPDPYAVAFATWLADSPWMAQAHCLMAWSDKNHYVLFGDLNFADKLRAYAETNPDLTAVMAALFMLIAEAPDVQGEFDCIRLMRRGDGGLQHLPIRTMGQQLLNQIQQQGEKGMSSRDQRRMVARAIAEWWTEDGHDVDPNDQDLVIEDAGRYLTTGELADWLIDGEDTGFELVFDEVEASPAPTSAPDLSPEDMRQISEALKATGNYVLANRFDLVRI